MVFQGLLPSPGAVRTQIYVRLGLQPDATFPAKRGETVYQHSPEYVTLGNVGILSTLAQSFLEASWELFAYACRDRVTRHLNPLHRGGTAGSQLAQGMRGDGQVLPSACAARACGHRRSR